MKHWTLRILLLLTLGAVTTVAVACACAKWSRLGVESVVDGERILWPYPVRIVVLDDAGVWSLTSKEPYVFVVDLVQHYEGLGLSRLIWIDDAHLLRPHLIDPVRSVVYDLRHFDLEGRGPVVLPHRGANRDLWSWSRVAPRPDEPAPFVIEQQAGWPCRALYSRTESSSVGVFHGQTHHWGFETSPGDRAIGADPRAHSYRVIPFLPVWPGFFIDTLFYAMIWFAIVFGLRCARGAIRRRRRRCMKCGYDLRGADNGCPECGSGRAGRESEQEAMRLPNAEHAGGSRLNGGRVTLRRLSCLSGFLPSCLRAFFHPYPIA